MQQLNQLSPTYLMHILFLLEFLFKPKQLFCEMHQGRFLLSVKKFNSLKKGIE